MFNSLITSFDFSNASKSNFLNIFASISSIIIFELISKKGFKTKRLSLLKVIFLLLKWELKILSFFLSYLKSSLIFVLSIFDFSWPLTKLFFLSSSNLIFAPKPEFSILKFILSKLFFNFVLNFFPKISPLIKFLLYPKFESLIFLISIIDLISSLISRSKLSIYILFFCL